MDIFWLGIGIFLAIVFAAIGLVFFIFRLNQKISKPPETDNFASLLNQQIEAFKTQITTQVGQINDQVTKLFSENIKNFQNIDKNIGSRLDNVGNRLDQAAKVVGEVQHRLGAVSEATQKVFEVGKDIASLQDILRAPKIRGSLGEFFLADLLAQVFPVGHYKLQHRFKSQEAVDAVIVLRDKLVSIDSKFPLESFKRMVVSQSEQEKIYEKKEFTRRVKKHIDDIAKKYILPDEGTFEFALMYIPAENVYYETIIKDENFAEEKSIFQYALDNKVIPVSPNSFYAYLQTILFGLRGMEIEAKAKEILIHINTLQGEFGKVYDEFSKIGTHLKNLNSAFENTEKRLGRFEVKLDYQSVESEPLKKLS